MHFFTLFFGFHAISPVLMLILDKFIYFGYNYTIKVGARLGRTISCAYGGLSKIGSGRGPKIDFLGHWPQNGQFLAKHAFFGHWRPGNIARIANKSKILIFDITQMLMIGRGTMTGKQHGVCCESESEMYDDRRCNKVHSFFCESESV